MKLLLTVEVEHDLLDVSTLLFALPLALDAVQRATSAGVGATGPAGMQVQVPNTTSLARIGFRLDYAETSARLPTGPVAAVSDAADSA